MGNDGGGGEFNYNAEWRGALDSANANLTKYERIIAVLKAERACRVEIITRKYGR